MRCVVAGSYGRFYGRISDEVIHVFEKAGIEVTYPSKSNIVAGTTTKFPIFQSDGLFIPATRDAVERYKRVNPMDVLLTMSAFLDERYWRNMQLKTPPYSEEELLRAIAIEHVFIEAGLQSDFVYIFNPDGYVGMSTSIELAHFSGKVPVYALSPINRRNREEMKRFISEHGLYPVLDSVYTEDQLEMFDDIEHAVLSNYLLRMSTDGHKREWEEVLFTPETLVEHLVIKGQSMR